MSAPIGIGVRISAGGQPQPPQPSAPTVVHRTSAVRQMVLAFMTLNVAGTKCRCGYSYGLNDWLRRQLLADIRMWNTRIAKAIQTRGSLKLINIDPTWRGAFHS
jgi:hypothetical protein